LNKRWNFLIGLMLAQLMARSAFAGMSAPFVLTDVARMRVEAISFFLVVLLSSSYSYQLFLLFVPMFVTGLAATGLQRQTQWLLGSNRRIYQGYRERRDRALCERNLRKLHDAIEVYAANHHGSMPESMEALKAWCDQEPVSRMGAWELSFPTVESYHNGVLESVFHGSFLYFGKSVKPDAEGRSVLVVDALANHDQTGAHVLFKDGSIEWLEEPEATELIKQLQSTNRAAK